MQVVLQTTAIGWQPVQPLHPKQTFTTPVHLVVLKHDRLTEPTQKVFQAKNSSTTQATKGYKLVCGRFTTGLANDETITLSGNASKIIAVIVGDNSTAAAGVTLKEAISDAGVATFKVTSTSDALVTCWMIVA